MSDKKEYIMNDETPEVNLNLTTDLQYLPAYLETVPEGTRLYLGCDSERIRKNGVWYADFCTVVVVHRAGNKGCKIFGKVERERDYDQKKDKPALRLMNEVYKVAQIYLDNMELFDEYDPEIHLDINPDEDYGSSCVITQAVGYIKGVCDIIPQTKPEAFSASYAADRFAYIHSQTSKKKGRRKRRKIERRTVKKNKGKKAS